MGTFFHRLRWDILLLVLLIIAGISFGYLDTLDAEPIGLHRWRQSDCASFAWNYYQGNGNFFHPELNNRLGRGDGEAVAELPIVYYLAGMLYKWWGPQPGFIRGINMLLVFLGFLAFGRLIRLWIEDPFWSIAIPVWAFSSPILLYFTNGFIPDTPALGITFMGWYAYFSYRKTAHSLHFFISLSLFTLAMLMKISMGISWVAVGIFSLADAWKGMAFYRIRGHAWRVSTFPPSRWLYFLLMGGMVWAWYYWAAWYSTHFDVPHFSGLVKPIYQLPPGDLDLLWKDLTLDKLDFMYASSTRWTLAILLVVLLFTPWGWKSGHLIKVVPLLLLGGAMYASMMFRLWVTHHYYQISSAIGVFWLMIFFGHFFHQFSKTPWISYAGKIILIALIYFSYHHSIDKKEQFFFHAGRPLAEHPTLYDPGLQTFLERAGAGKEALFMSLIDISPNNNLYLLRRKGWSTYNNPQNNAAVIDILHREYELQFLIINDPRILNHPALLPALTNPLGAYKGLYLFEIK